MSKRIAIDAGHGLHTSGKRCLKSIDKNETREWFLNQRIASKIENILADYDCDTLRLDDTTGENDIPLIQRTNKANGWLADWVISCHHNAGVNGGKVGGIVVFTYTKPRNAEEVAMQKAIYESCLKHGALTGRSEPMNRANFHMVREPKCNSILIEYGFMDSQTDTPVILTEDFADRMATATAEALITQLNLKMKEGEEMTAEEKKEFESLQKEVSAIKEELKQIKVFHYWSEIKEEAPWAYNPLKALYDKGLFSGASASDLNVPLVMLRSLVCMAAMLKKQGLLKYE